MFKTPINVRYVESGSKQIGMYWLEKYLMVLWLAGSYLLVLIALTLAKTSPFLSKILGELLVCGITLIGK